MSENTRENETSIVDDLVDYLEVIREEVENRFSDDTETSFERKEEEYVPLPSNKDIVEECFKDLAHQKRVEKAREKGIQNVEKYPLDKIEITMDMKKISSKDETYLRVREFSNILENSKRQILASIIKNNFKGNENPAVSDDVEPMTYLIDRNGGVNNDVIIIGGAESLIYELCEKFNFTEDERRLIQRCHAKAAETKYVDHTLVEQVLIIPKFQQEIKYMNESTEEINSSEENLESESTTKQKQETA